MKLKYYLRGLGMGILFATIVMMVHNNNLPAEQIIEQAKKLGMVMPEDTEEKNGLWGDKEDSEQDAETENPLTDSQSEAESTLPPDTQEQSDAQTPAETQEQTDSQQSADTQQVSDTSTDIQQPSESQEVTYVKITINAKNSAERVCRTLYQNGLIDSEEGFHAYLQEMGYTHIIQKGTFHIPIGATYEEICAIIIKEEYL